MSNDQMQDVYPISFEFVEGELPTDRKLTALVAHTDTAFSNVTQAVGDPWDYQSHSTGLLSLTNLSQSSLARVIGPSDWASPVGGCWNEAMSSTVDITLAKNKNSWILGYPLVSVSTPITEASQVAGSITKLIWGVLNDIEVVTDLDSVLVTEMGSAAAVVSTGQFYVDYYKGTIVSYDTPSTAIVLRVSDLNMLGAGVPWGTHNVIPTWNSVVALCNCSVGVPVGGGRMQYTLTLPVVDASPRVPSHFVYGGPQNYENLSSYDTLWGVNGSNLGTQYRLPAALTTAGLIAGDTLPGGYLLLWDETAGRVTPLVTFKYKDANSLTLETTTDWLTAGDNYRIITSGSSVTEAISYLFETTRNAASLGLTNSPTLSYSVPISHDNLEHRFSGDLSSSFTDGARSEVDTNWLKFRESSYPTNPHSQYLHRYGYMGSDESGNDSNAMRGDLLLLAKDLGHDTYSNSYRVAFGTILSNWIGFSGARDETPGTGAVDTAAVRYGFNLDSVGSNHTANDTDEFGAFVLHPYQGAPVYIQGRSGGNFTYQDYRGAILGFDLGTRAEMNYIKLLPGCRSGTYDVVNMSADTGQTSFGTQLDITPSLSNKLSPKQIREWRFRGAPNVEDADLVTSDSSIGDTESVTEFDYYFTSPGMIGADFLNLYSNAIFFSDQGDGKLTSFTENGETWMDGDATHRPSSINYIPSATTPRFTFVCYESNDSGNESKTPLAFGHEYGFQYLGDGNISIVTAGTTTLTSTGTTDINSTGATTIDAVAALSLTTETQLNLWSYDDIYISAGPNLAGLLLYTPAPQSTGPSNPHLVMRSAKLVGSVQILTKDASPSLVGEDILIQSGENIYMYADTSIGLYSTLSLNLFGYDDTTISAGNNIPTNANNGGALTHHHLMIKGDKDVGSVQIITKDSAAVSMADKDIMVNSGADIAMYTTTDLLFSVGGSMYIFGLPVDATKEIMYIDPITRIVSRQGSSMKYKDNIKDIDEASWILDLDTKEFNFKSSPNTKVYGLIAEDVYKINKEIVIIGEDGEPDGIRYDSVFTSLIKLVQEQQKEIDELRTLIGK